MRPTPLTYVLRKGETNHMRHYGTKTRPKFARIIVRVLGLASVGLMTSYAHPESATADERHTELEEVTIVGSRLDADVIGVESIDLSDTPPPFTLTQALRSLSSAAISQSGNVGSLTQLRVRGAEADHVKVLLNGNPVNLASGNLNFSTISPVAIARIDALNGPRSAIWGHDALAGVINLTTSPINPANRIYADTGSNQTWSLGADLGAEIADVPISLHIAKRASEGTNVSYEGSEPDGFSQDALHVGYQKVGANLQASGFLRGTKSSSDYDPIPRDGDRSVDVDDQILAQRFTWQPTDELQLSANGSITRSKLHNFSEGNETNSSTGDLKRLTVEGRYSLTRSQDIGFLLDRTMEEFEQRGSPSFFGNPNYDESMAATGLVGEYLFTADRFQWHSSFRREQNNEFGNSTAWQTSALLRNGSFRWSYSVGVGIKNPTFIERFGFTPDTFLGNPDLKPEHSLQHQVALLYEHQNQSLKIALYSSTLEDEINGFSYNVEANQFTAANLESKSRRQGAEIRYTRMIENLSFETNYTYVKSEENQEPEIRRPKHLANLDVRYALNDQLRSVGSVHYVGEQLDRDFSSFPSTIVTLNGHVLANLSLEYDITPKLTIHGMVDNLLNTEYEHVYGFRTPQRSFSVGARAAF